MAANAESENWKQIRGSGTNLPSFKEMRKAHQRVVKYVHRTPVIECTSITKMTNHSRVVFKCENFQRTGSFKIRGATNAILKIREEAAKRGAPPPSCVVTHSSGNHAQALSRAARSVGIDAHIVVPKNAPAVKAAAVKGYGGVIHYCVPTLEARETTAAKVMREHPSSVFIHPYDNPNVIAGQGTVGIELVEQTMDTPLDAVIVPVGGGGLLTGVATAIKSLSPSTKVFAAEPLGANDTSRSFAAKERVKGHLEGLPKTMADGLLTLNSDRTFKGISKYVDGVFTATEEEISRAFRIVYERAKLVIEPSAAVGVAVLLANHQELRGFKNVGVVICGGNVELDRLAEYLNVGSSKL